MPVRVKCPTGHQLIVPDSRCGTVVICPRCDQAVSVPALKAKAGARPAPPKLSEGAAREATQALQRQEVERSEMPEVTATTQAAEPTPVPTVAEPAHTPTVAEPAHTPTVERGAPPITPRVTDAKSAAKVISAPGKVLEALEAKPISKLAPTPPAIETPVVEKPPAEKPVVEKPVVEKPVVEKPVVEKPVVEKPPAEKSVVEKPTSEVPTAESLVPEKTPLRVFSPIPEAPATEAEAAEDAPAAPSEETKKAEADEAAEKKEERGTLSDVVASPTATVDSAGPSLTHRATEEEAPPEPPPPPPFPEPQRIGVLHEPARLLVAWQVAAAIALTAIFSLCPALIEIVDHFRAEDSPGISRWVWAVLLVGVVQLGYALFIAQLPDWTSLWAASLQALAAAAGYAAVLGFVVTSPSDHWLLQFLQVSDQLGGGRAALWCILMIAAMSLLAYFSGFVSVRWHKAEMVTRSLAARH